MAADGRFAPSPTGTLHLGNLRTALLAWLFARSAGARFLVRMEDLDPGRVRMDSAREQLEDLAAIGLDWDGDVLWQSARAEAYESAIARLRAEDRVYECFCTRAEIRAASSAPHGPLPEGHYPGTCLRLTDGERRRKRAGGRPPALRLRAGAERVRFQDRLLGRYEMVVDDFVVRRNDGAAAYNLAVMVDDAAQGIGEVVRGADLLDSTPRQVLLTRLLGLPEPSWAHVPLVLGARRGAAGEAPRVGDIARGGRGRGGAVDGSVAGVRAGLVRRRDAGGVRSGAAAAGADDVHGRVMRAVGDALQSRSRSGSSRSRSSRQPRISCRRGVARGRARSWWRSPPPCSARC